jgi:hypothetical protein
VAKDQRLSLNPTQISGACGRLMCSLRYEHEFYVQARKRFPKEGRTVKTVAGEERVLSNDIFRERVTLRNMEGETRIIALAQLLQETAASGSPIVPVVTPRDPAPPVDREADEYVPGDERDDPVVAEAGADGPSEAEPPPPGMQSAADAATPHPTGAERRPHRRRGRRGGRRNRGGGGDAGAKGGSDGAGKPSS